MSYNLLSPVSDEEYQKNVFNLEHTKYTPPGRRRMLFSLSVVKDFLENEADSEYDIEDFVFELNSLYGFSIKYRNCKFKGCMEIAMEIEKVCVYAYSKKGLSEYRKGSKRIGHCSQFQAILKFANDSIVSLFYKTKYVERKEIA